MTLYKLLVVHSYTGALDKPLVLKKALVPMLPQDLSLRLSDYLLLPLRFMTHLKVKKMTTKLSSMTWMKT